MKKTFVLLAFVLTTNARAQTACTQSSALACGTTSSTLTASDCTAFDSSSYRLWTFSGNAGDAVTIDMTSTSFDAFLALLDPSGTPVADNDDVSSGNTNARITFTLTASGKWTAVANSLKAAQIGDYTITLSSSSCPATTSVPRKRAVGHG